MDRDKFEFALSKAMFSGIVPSLFFHPIIDSLTDVVANGDHSVIFLTNRNTIAKIGRIVKDNYRDGNMPGPKIYNSTYDRYVLEMSIAYGKHFDYLDLEQCIKVLKTLNRLHSQRLSHGNFDQSHILIDGGNISLINFGVDHRREFHYCHNLCMALGWVKEAMMYAEGTVIEEIQQSVDYTPNSHQLYLAYNYDDFISWDTMFKAYFIDLPTMTDTITIDYDQYSDHDQLSYLSERFPHITAAELTLLVSSLPDKWEKIERIVDRRGERLQNYFTHDGIVKSLQNDYFEYRYSKGKC